MARATTPVNPASTPVQASLGTVAKLKEDLEALQTEFNFYVEEKEAQIRTLFHHVETHAETLAAQGEKLETAVKTVAELGEHFAGL